MIGNLQYIVLCRLIAHLEHNKAIEMSDKQIVWWEDESRAQDMCSSLVEGVNSSEYEKKDRMIPGASRASRWGQSDER
jgi:hypothetical protein